MRETEININSNDQLKKYRPIPFWSWNDKLQVKRLISQIEWMKQNNVGGFFMHARSGLKTEYLSEDWMNCIDECQKYADNNDMEAWIYDENGWPSGFAGGKLLEDIENHDKYLTYTIGDYDCNSMVSYLISKDKIIRTNCAGDGKYLNVFCHYSTSTVDILNPEVVKKFIKLTHETYKNRFGNEFSRKFKGFFTDEPQYYRWSTPYTEEVKKYFAQQLSQDILDGIGLLFIEKQGYKKFRYQYWKAMQYLMVNNFSKQIYDWCELNHVKLTGHFIEECSLYGQMLCCAGIMPNYQYEHIPGIDWLGRYCNSHAAVKQASSVANQMGREQVLCETYACGGWSNSPFEMKVLTDFLYFNGVNLICNHLLPYSEKGNRIHDHPSHFYDGNPWVKHYFKDFNNYFIKLGALLSDNPERVHIAVLHPIRSAYFDYKREGDENNQGGLIRLQKLFDDAINQIAKYGLPYHLIDEDILHNIGNINGNKIVCGNCEYDTLILPCNITMDKETERMVYSYSKNGGEILILNYKPSLLEAEPYDYEYLESNTSFEDLVKNRNYSFKSENGDFFLSDRNDFLFVINHSVLNSTSVTFDYKGKFNSFCKVDIVSGDKEVIPLSFSMQPGESMIIYPFNSDTNERVKEKFEIAPDLVYNYVNSDENSLVIDKVSYSSDGINYCEPTCVPIAFQKLLSERFKGKLNLKYFLNVKVIPEIIYFTTGITGITDISVNGIKVEVCNNDEFKYEISSLLKKGNNTIEITMDYYQDENVYNVLFGKNITESLKNCLVYNSEIEPLIFKGKFGVFETDSYKKGRLHNSLYGKSFYIGSIVKQFKGLIEGGFPFFAGQITLKSDFNVTNTESILKIPGCWHAASVKINGNKAGTMLLNRTLDISKFTKTGFNTAEIKFTIGNRNLLGPHHYNKNDDPISLGPSNFEFPDYFNEEKENFTSDTILIEQLN